MLGNRQYDGCNGGWGEACTQTTTWDYRIKESRENFPLPPPVVHIRHFETILYELIYLVVSLKVKYLRDPGETQSVILGTFNRQLTHRRLE